MPHNIPMKKKKRHSARPGTWQQLLHDAFLFTEFRLGCTDRSLRLLCSWSQCTSAVTCTVWLCRCLMCGVYRLVYSVHLTLLEQLVCPRFISIAWRRNKWLRRDDETDDSGETGRDGEEQYEWCSSDFLQLGCIIGVFLNNFSLLSALIKVAAAIWVHSRIPTT